MPNWCVNSVEIIHKDKEKLKEAVQAFIDGKFLSYALPEPEGLLQREEVSSPAELYTKEARERLNLDSLSQGLGVNLGVLYAPLEDIIPEKLNWYDWRCRFWGTKWEVEYQGEEGENLISADGKKASFFFYSAWSPPLAAYDALVDQGFHVKADYFEPGCDFCGQYVCGVDTSFEMSEIMEHKRVHGFYPSDVPLSLCDAISDEQQSYEEMKMEEEEDETEDENSLSVI